MTNWYNLPQNTHKIGLNEVTIKIPNVKILVELLKILLQNDEFNGHLYI